MKGYLRAIITEQIDRGISLKKLIPRPSQYPEIMALADRCARIIDENVGKLNELLEELDERKGDDVRNLYRGFRICARDIELVEYFGISALYYERQELGYLNKLLFKIHQEIGLPLTPPGVACISTMYYFFHPFTNVIFVPVGESEFLLHLPDLFHEIGHGVSCNKENESRLKGVHEKYTLAVHKITEYYGQLLTKKRRETGPSEIPRLIMHIHSQWKNWIEEFFSDLFALYTLGPAYAWSHLHVTIKKSQSVYDFSPILPRTHPSDDGRMRMLIIGMRLVGFEDEAKAIWAKWRNMPLTVGTQPVVEYQYAYPEELMTEVASAILQGIKESGFAIVVPKRLTELNEKSVIRLLNDAWDLFWKEPNGFRNWEEKKIQEFKSKIIL